MKFDLTNKFDRLKFIKRANALLKSQRTCVELTDQSNRTLNQNSYLHILCRILASETGVTEYYAKQVYLKELACPDIFVTVTKDTTTGKMVRVTRSTTELDIPEMRKAISRLRTWAEEYPHVILPDAKIEDDGTVTFNSNEEADGFRRAEVAASKSELDL